MIDLQKINLMIIGVQKAGTTSLLHYLKSHPDISGHRHNEFSYFVESNYSQASFNNQFIKQFKFNNEPVIVAKNITLSLSERALINLQQHNADIKIVLLLRNPVDRAYSAYNMHKRDGKISRAFFELKAVLENNDYENLLYKQYIKPGIYINQLKSLRKCFPDKNVKLFLFEDFIKDPQKICTEIFAWLQLTDIHIDNINHNPTLKPKSQLFASVIKILKNQNNPLKKFIKTILPYSWYRRIADTMVSHNSGSEKFPEMNADIRDILDRYYQKHNQELNNLIMKYFTESHKLMSHNNWLNKDANL